MGLPVVLGFSYLVHYCSFGFCVFRLCCLLRGAVCVAIIPELGLVGF